MVSMIQILLMAEGIYGRIREGSGSFFKAHKDTPRGENVFGSLVVVFPTQHEGGALQLRHKGQGWTFDSAAITSTQKVPSIAYVAFYSDVEHEVSMVTSGYRVTLTYNLYFDDTTSNPPHSWMKEDELALRASLSTLLDHRDLLPDGGYLGFGLEFMYPVARGSIRGLINSLKGSDAMIKLVLDQLDLQPQVKIIYEDNQDVYHPGYNYLRGGTQQPSIKRPHIMLDDEDQFPGYEIEEPLRVELPTHGHGIVICGVDEVGEYPNHYNGEVIRAKKVLWVTPQTTFSQLKTSYVHYGNEATIGYIYGNVCLVAEVPAFGKRVKHTKRARVE
jgi:hypothetical protein